MCVLHFRTNKNSRFLASCVIEISHRINTCIEEIIYIVEESKKLFHRILMKKFKEEHLFYQSFFLLFARSDRFI